MIIVTKIKYPPESAKEIASRFLEAPQVPSYLDKHGPYFTSSMDDGIIGMSVYKLEKADLAEANEFLGNYMATYFGVSGFKYEIQPYFEAEEGLKMIGMG
tara:strand:+ start:477 stop:776 length:300 start_codon:yes stop_codon:yes gene_type:complete